MRAHLAERIARLWDHIRHITPWNNPLTLPTERRGGARAEQMDAVTNYADKPRSPTPGVRTADVASVAE